MNKTELAQALCAVTHIGTKAHAIAVVDAMFEVISDELSSYGKVLLPGFGTFDTKQRKARKGADPRTGKEIDIPAKIVVRFKPGKTLADRVAENV